MQIRQLVEDMHPQFTRAERQVASVLLADYPFAGLQPIQLFSRRANVSAPSISRFVSKLGCAGFQDFQQRLVQELKAGQPSPIELRREGELDAQAPLTSYLDRVSRLQAQLGERVGAAQIERLCLLIGDPRRHVYLIGGRMSDTIARFFALHLRQIRPDVYHLPTDPETWPEYLLRLRQRDVLVVFDFRRYQRNLAQLTQTARRRRTRIIVVTDSWVSPAARGATELISIPIDSGTLWDSYVPAMTLVEALLVPLAERDWAATRERIAAWDALRAERSELPAEATLEREPLDAVVGESR